MKALLLVDLQIDFFPGGALSVASAFEIVDKINQLTTKFHANGDLVVATKDWHPITHCSFVTNHPGKNVGDVVVLDNKISQILWPVHCVKNTPGADFVSTLHQRYINKIFYKGVVAHTDAYSAFFNADGTVATDLHDYLQANDVKTIDVVGLATDYCVNFNVLDAAKLKYNVNVHVDLCRAFNNDKRNLDSIYANWTANDVKIIQEK